VFPPAAPPKGIGRENPVVPVPVSPISVNLRYRFICCLFRIAQFERTPEARLEVSNVLSIRTDGLV
jgi:hypothetical protein